MRAGKCPSSRQCRTNTPDCVSRNGATEVVKWEILAGNKADALTSVTTAPKTGFETTIVLESTSAFTQARAYDGWSEHLLLSAFQLICGVKLQPKAGSSARAQSTLLIAPSWAKVLWQTYRSHRKLHDTGQVQIEVQSSLCYVGVYQTVR